MELSIIVTWCMTSASQWKFPAMQLALHASPDFPLTLARWPMASEHCRRTSDFLSYWPGLDSGISKIAEK